MQWLEQHDTVSGIMAAADSSIESVNDDFFLIEIQLQHITMIYGRVVSRAIILWCAIACVNGIVPLL